MKSFTLIGGLILFFGMQSVYGSRPENVKYQESAMAKKTREINVQQGKSKGGKVAPAPKSSFRGQQQRMGDDWKQYKYIKTPFDSLTNEQVRAKYDTVCRKELLSENCWPKGFPPRLDCSNPAMDVVREMIKRDLKVDGENAGERLIQLMKQHMQEANETTLYPAIIESICEWLRAFSGLVQIENRLMHLGRHFDFNHKMKADALSYLKKNIAVANNIAMNIEAVRDIINFYIDKFITDKRLEGVALESMQQLKKELLTVPSQEDQEEQDWQRQQVWKDNPKWEEYDAPDGCPNLRSLYGYLYQLYSNFDPNKNKFGLVFKNIPGETRETIGDILDFVYGAVADKDNEGKKIVSEIARAKMTRSQFKEMINYFIDKFINKKYRGQPDLQQKNIDAAEILRKKMLAAVDKKS